MRVIRFVLQINSPRVVRNDRACGDDTHSGGAYQITVVLEGERGNGVAIHSEEVFRELEGCVGHSAPPVGNEEHDELIQDENDGEREKTAR